MSLLAVVAAGAGPKANKLRASVGPARRLAMRSSKYRLECKSPRQSPLEEAKRVKVGDQK
jgi:hypothetical protein